jgi:hypothetical protein
MGKYKEIYEFASSAGALEGYVYSRPKSEIAGLDNWINNLVKQYQNLTIDVRESFQTSLDRTIGRALQSLIPIFGKDHDYITTLETLVKGKMPDSPSDFEKEKKEKSKKYGA